MNYILKKVKGLSQKVTEKDEEKAVGDLFLARVTRRQVKKELLAILKQKAI